MAEAVGLIASVASLADFGFKLSVKLFTYGQAMVNADKSIKDISNDISLTSTVLQELSGILKAGSSIISAPAVSATENTVQECLSVFKELEAVLESSWTPFKEVNQKSARVERGLERMKWPFKQNKLEPLRANLDRLKASLTLMLQVLSYGQDIQNRLVLAIFQNQYNV